MDVDNFWFIGSNNWFSNNNIIMNKEKLEEFKNIKKNREELMVSGTREELIKFDENLEMLKEEIDESIETLKKNLGDLQMIRLML